MSDVAHHLKEAVDALAHVANGYEGDVDAATEWKDQALLEHATLRLASVRAALAFVQRMAAVGLRELEEDGSPRWVLSPGQLAAVNDKRPTTPAVRIFHSNHVGFVIPDDREHMSWRPGEATAFGLALIAADCDALVMKAREDAVYERTGPMAWEDDERAREWRKRQGVLR